MSYKYINPKCSMDSWAEKCSSQLVDVDDVYKNYYTKEVVDGLLDEKLDASAYTPVDLSDYYTKEQVDEKISGITFSGVTEQELNDAIASAKTEIEAEIPSLDGYATQEWVTDQHYITGVDLSNYATLQDIPTVPTKVSAFENDVPYLTEHQSLSGYATTAFVSAYTYDKSTIDEKVAQGGSFDPTQYYNKTATDALLDEKLDASAYTPCDLSDYYNKQEVNDIVTSAITDVEAEIPSLSGYATEQWVLDKHYITGVDLSDYATKEEIPTVPTSNTAFTNDAGYLTEHQSLSAYSTTQEMNAAISNATSGMATQQWVEDKHYITGVDLSNYATLQDIPTVPTSNTAFTNDAGYITSSALNGYATEQWVNNQGFLTEHQSLSAYSTTQEMNSAISQATSGKVDNSTYTAYTANTQTTINNKADSSTLNNYMLKSQIWCGTEQQWASISGNPDSNTIYLIHS